MSMKKSLLLLAAVILAVTLFSLMSSGGNTMDIRLTDTAIVLSGIEGRTYTVDYTDILDARLGRLSDYSQDIPESQSHLVSLHQPGLILFVSTQCDTVVECTLLDGGKLVFNYNNPSGTEGIRELLLKNLK